MNLQFPRQITREEDAELQSARNLLLLPLHDDDFRGNIGGRRICIECDMQDLLGHEAQREDDGQPCEGEQAAQSSGDVRVACDRAEKMQGSFPVRTCAGPTESGLRLGDE